MEKDLIGKINVRRQAILLRKYNPDIIFLQEIDMYTKRSHHRNQLYILSKYTGPDFRAMGTNIKDKKLQQRKRNQTNEENHIICSFLS